MGFVGTVFLGWLIKNVPEIIKKSQALIQRMNEVRLTLTEWVENTLSSLRTFTTNLVGVRTSFENVGLDAAADEQDKESQLITCCWYNNYNDFVRQIQLFRDFDVVDAVKRLLGYSEEPRSTWYSWHFWWWRWNWKIWITFTFHWKCRGWLQFYVPK